MRCIILRERTYLTYPPTYPLKDLEERLLTRSRCAIADRRGRGRRCDCDSSLQAPDTLPTPHQVDADTVAAGDHIPAVAAAVVDPFDLRAHQHVPMTVRQSVDKWARQDAVCRKLLRGVPILQHDVGLLGERGLRISVFGPAPRKDLDYIELSDARDEPD